MNTEHAVFCHVPGIGMLSLRGFDPARDLDTVHAWLTDPHARFWGMTGQSRERTAAYFQAITASDTHEAWIGQCAQRPCFLVETYAPAADAVGAHYPVAVGDRGMHLLVAPTDRPVHGFTWAVFSFVTATLLAREDTRRLVVEPDENNQAIHRLNRRAGFVYERRIDMGDKTAWLAFCTRADHAAAIAAERESQPLILDTESCS